MLLTRSSKQTVIERLRRDPEFAKALFDEAATLFLNGEAHTARLLLRDLVNATIGFEGLARETAKPAKSLHRMLSANGNPSMDNLAAPCANGSAWRSRRAPSRPRKFRIRLESHGRACPGHPRSGVGVFGNPFAAPSPKELKRLDVWAFVFAEITGEVDNLKIRAIVNLERTVDTVGTWLRHPIGRLG
jgi:DNA-binding phage protein